MRSLGFSPSRFANLDFRTGPARSFVIALTVLAGVNCRGTTRQASAVPAPDERQSYRIIPTRYDRGRFFAIPEAIDGKRVTLLLDTGDNSRVWESFAQRFGLKVDSSSVPKPLAMVGLPPLKPGRSLPSPALNAGKVHVTPPQDAFDTLMSRVADGQLGFDWFADRIWTLDYPGHQLTLHDVAPRAHDGDHETPLGFPVDSTGHRLGHVPRIAIVIDGDSLNMLFDTGATIWLAAGTRIGGVDATSPEQPVSIAWQWLFERWRQRHPDWPVVNDGDVVSHAPLIRVPNARIAGFDTGPVWFREFVGPKVPPPSRNPTMPLVRSPFVGTVGGNILQNFVITLDYPKATARFRKAN